MGEIPVLIAAGMVAELLLISAEGTAPRAEIPELTGSTAVQCFFVRFAVLEMTGSAGKFCDVFSKCFSRQLIPSEEGTHHRNLR
jgi:hypothetical protein